MIFCMVYTAVRALFLLGNFPYRRTRYTRTYMYTSGNVNVHVCT